MLRYDNGTTFTGWSSFAVVFSSTIAFRVWRPRLHVARKQEGFLITQHDVSGWVDAGGDARLNPFKVFIFQITSAFLTAHPDDEAVIELAVKDSLFSLRIEPTAPTGASVRAALFLNLEDGWGLDRPAAANAIPLPAVAGPVVPVGPVIPPAPALHLYAADKARLARWRTQRTTARGRALAAAAKLLRGSFQWVKSGPVPNNIPAHLQAHFPQHAEPFKPKAVWSASQTDVGWDVHDAVQHNDFARWMNDGGPDPDHHAHMNCWEFVFFAAYRAGLVSKRRLSDIHEMATIMARGRNPNLYYGVLNDALGMRTSVRARLTHGLIPREGDILFFDGNTHVAISLGRRWVGGNPEDRMMTLWLHDNRRVTELTIEDMPVHMQDDITYAPCPF